MHLADAFIQSDLHSGYIYFCQYMCSLGIEPTTFALLTQCSTTEPQEHYLIIFFLMSYDLPLHDLFSFVPEMDLFINDSR